MAFKKKSYPVHPKDMERFSELPVVLAVLIDAGFITHWPHEWTRDGNRSRRRAAIDDGRRGYNAMTVYDEANQQLYYAQRTRAFIKPPGMLPDTKVRNEAYNKLCRMKGDAQDAEAID